MSKVLRTTAAFAVFAFAATGDVKAAPTSLHEYYAQPGYAGPAYSQAPRALWPWYVPSHGIESESCGDAFQPICNSERPYD